MHIKKDVTVKYENGTTNLLGFCLPIRLSSWISLLFLLFLWSVDRHLAGVVLADNRRDIPFFRSFPFYEQNITEVENITSSF